MYLTKSHVLVALLSLLASRLSYAPISGPLAIALAGEDDAILNESTPLVQLYIKKLQEEKKYEALEKLLADLEELEKSRAEVEELQQLLDKVYETYQKKVKQSELLQVELSKIRQIQGTNYLKLGIICSCIIIMHRKVLEALKVSMFWMMPFIQSKH